MESGGVSPRPKEDFFQLSYLYVLTLSVSIDTILRAEGTSTVGHSWPQKYGDDRAIQNTVLVLVQDVDDLF